MNDFRSMNSDNLKKSKEASDDMSWTTVSSEYVIRRPWLIARCDKVKLPTGAVIDEYYVLEYPDWVNVIAITDEGKFVFVRQYRYALKKTVNELCAGVCEDGEEPEAAARRELMEETGFGGGEWEKTMVLSCNASTCQNFTHCFIARGVSHVGTQHLDNGEDIKVLLFTRDEVFGMLPRGEIWQSLMAAPLWKFFYSADNK